MIHVNLEGSLTDMEKGKSELAATAIENLLEQYGCVLVAVPYIGADGRISAEVHVMPKLAKERQQQTFHR